MLDVTTNKIALPVMVNRPRDYMIELMYIQKQSPVPEKSSNVFWRKCEILYFLVFLKTYLSKDFGTLRTLEH